MSNNQEKLNEQLFNVVADEKVSDEARLKKLKYLYITALNGEIK